MRKVAAIVLPVILILGVLATVFVVRAKVTHADGSAGTWTVTGNMNVARSWQTATLLPNGRVLVAGGLDAIAGEPTATAELYDPSTGTWTPTGSMNFTRYFATATLLPNGQVLVAGGATNSGGLASAELYDPSSGTWTLTDSMNVARYLDTATLLPNGEVLVAGGFNISTGLVYSSAELYDPNAFDPTTGLFGTWTLTGSMNTARYLDTATLLPNGQVLVAGGSGPNYGGSSLTSAELYDPSSGTWTLTGSMNVGRTNYTATLLPDGQVLAADGDSNGQLTSSAELYEPSSSTWTLTGSMNMARYEGTATLLPSGAVLVAGGLGTSGSNGSTSAELYDPSSGTWTLTGRMNAGHVNDTATLLPNGQVLVAGASTTSNPINSSAELYTPGPQIGALPNATIPVGSAYTASGSFTDPGATSWTATVDYGDGSGPQPLTLSGTTFTLSHTYTSAGVYSVDVMVTDNVGESGSATWMVAVDAPAAFTSGSSASTGMRVPFSFTVTTTGSPTPSLSESGALPTGITFVDNGNGTGTLAGEAAAGTSGTYLLTITATNGVGSPATQSFTLSVTTSSSAPVITISSDIVVETFGIPFTFTVTTDGYPVPTLSKTGTLPPGVMFVDNGNGTATIGGTPSGTALGAYTLTLKAKNSVSTVTEILYLGIVETPVFKSVTIPVGHVGTAYSLTLKTSAFLTASLTESGALPTGLGFVDNGNGTATISGTPLPGSGGAYAITVTATNQAGSSTKAFTLTVHEGPTITSSSSASATVGQSFSFAVTATGYPAPSISKGGALPKGLTYKSSTHTIAGTPAAGSQGTYLLVFTAKNSSGMVQQTFTLTVN